MGTRSITQIFNEEGKEIIRLYRQFDGYFEGHGKDLVTFLKGKSLVSGFSGDHMLTGKAFNGMEDLAIRLCAYLKNDQARHNNETDPEHKYHKPDALGEDTIGNFYIQPIENPVKIGDYGSEFLYEIKSIGTGGIKQISLVGMDSNNKKKIFKL
jgi:hypothetical protein